MYQVWYRCIKIRIIPSEILKPVLFCDLHLNTCEINHKYCFDFQTLKYNTEENFCAQAWHRYIDGLITQSLCSRLDI